MKLKLVVNTYDESGEQIGQFLLEAARLTVVDSELGERVFAYDEETAKLFSERDPRNAN